MLEIVEQILDFTILRTTGYTTMIGKLKAGTTRMDKNICAAAVFAGALLFYSAARSKYQRKSKQARKDEKDGEASSRDGKIVISHQLLDKESVYITFDVPPITTLTWFQGDFRAAKV